MPGDTFLKNGEDDVLNRKIYDRISPEYVNETLNASYYSSFFKRFEAGAHNAIPMFIRGEWLNFTATNDPVFLLHHAQVDRLWWLWQNRDFDGRSKEYFGPSENFLEKHPQNSESHSMDLLPMDGLVKNGKSLLEPVGRSFVLHVSPRASSIQETYKRLDPTW
ncbi:Tyrosinase ustQ [Colletotrichum siamense]|uniref:Tyrosinase ustQ n=1 Tax=Colletotrichum siamense TaxID=690259 RepID=A0A9P5K608_COLSI|nr:Tyrosinase ustQ [Colletotrichum siamense]KAF4859416.1 Tyrosinase ustQ [Colletotrichum siamense]